MRKEGFTIIELMVTVAIIAILAAIAIPQLNRFNLKSKRTAVLAALATIHKGQTAHYAASGQFLPENCAAFFCQVSPTEAPLGPRITQELGFGPTLQLPKPYVITFYYSTNECPGPANPQIKSCGYFIWVEGNIDQDPTDKDYILVRYQDPMGWPGPTNGVPYIWRDDLFNKYYGS